MAPPDSGTRRQQLVRIAFERFQAEQQQDAERKAFDDALQEGALETGLDPSFLAKAEEELARRETLAAQKAEQGRRRLRMFSLVALAVVALGAASYGASRALFPPPPAPWVETFDAPASWGLDANPASRATLSWEQAPDRGQVAVIRVEAFGQAQDGRYHVNLDGVNAPADASGYTQLAVDLKGSLPVARVFLEAGGAERWRSPPIHPGGEWTSHRLPLRSFERQEREGGAWRVVSWRPPRGLTRVSIKVGHFMNPPEAAGDLYVDGLRLEAP